MTGRSSMGDILSIKVITDRPSRILRAESGSLNQRFAVCLLLAFASLCVGWAPSLLAESSKTPSKKQASSAELTDLEAAFNKLETADGHVAEELDVEIGKSITKSPAEFLAVLKKHQSKIVRLDALVGNLGYDFVDNFDKQAVELRKRIKALESVSDQGLKPIAAKCIAEIRSKLKIIEAPVQSAHSSEKSPRIDSRYRKAKYFTGEVVPGYAVNLTFNVAHCPISSVLPAVNEYESETSLNSVDTGKPTPVRIVHLYFFENAPIEKCSVQGGEKYVEINHKIAPDLGRMTHYFITMGENITIETLANKKASE